MVNLSKLKLKIFENGMNISQLAEQIGMDKSTLYRKFQKNGDNISIKEANLMVKTLHLTVEEANSIFFSQYVA